MTSEAYLLQLRVAQALAETSDLQDDSARAEQLKLAEELVPRPRERDLEGRVASLRRRRPRRS